MADVPISTKDLSNLEKSLQDLTRTLGIVDQKVRQVFNRDFPGHVRTAEKEFERALSDADRAMKAKLDSMSTKVVAAIGRMKREEAAAFVDAAETHAGDYVKTLLGNIQSGLSFGLPRALGPLAMVAGPINQLSAIQAENMKIATQWGASYGNILPGQIQTTLKGLGNLNLQMTQMSNRYRQSKEDILATTEALARNTVVQQKGIMATTQSIAALSRLHGIPMADLTSQMVTLTKELNVQVQKTPDLYGNVAAYAKEAAMGQQFLMQTSIALASALKSQGSDVLDYAGFISVATKNLEKMGVSERAAAEAAESSIKGFSSLSFGVGAYVAQGMEANINKLVGKKGGVANLPANIRSAYVQVASTTTGKEFDVTKDADVLAAIQAVNKQGLLGAGYLAQLTGGTSMFREAARDTMNRLNVPMTMRPYYMQQVMHQQGFMAAEAALTPGGGAYTAGAKGMTPKEQSATKDYMKSGEELSRAQMSYWDKSLRKLAEIKTDTRWMGPLTLIAGSIAALMMASQYRGFKATTAKNASLYKRLLGGGASAAGVAEGEAVGSTTAYAGYSASSMSGGIAAGTATAAEEAAPAAMGMGARIASMGLKALPGIGGAITGGFAGYMNTARMTSNTSTLSTGVGQLGAIGTGTGYGAMLAMQLGQPELVPIAAGIGAAASALVPIGKALYLMGQMDLEVYKGNQAKALQKDTEDKAASSKKLGFDITSIPEKDRGKVAALYNDIQAGNRSHQAVNLDRIIESFVKSGAMSREEAVRALKELAKAAPQTKVGENMSLINALSGKNITITISDPGSDSANLNSWLPDAPHGSTGPRDYGWH
jgi:polyhydroxyalkanoate synthesis regulator phasin